MSLRTDYKWELVLYPDATNYSCDDVLRNAQKFFDHWAYILHDKDYNEDGTPKKSHYHFYGRKDKNWTPKGICYQLSIPENALSNVHSWKGAIRYLTHIDFAEKQPYPKESIVSNFDIDKYFVLSNGEEISDDDKAAMIFNHIKEVYGTPKGSLPAIAEWVIENHLWSAYRRGYAVWSQLINNGGCKK